MLHKIAILLIFVAPTIVLASPFRPCTKFQLADSFRFFNFISKNIIGSNFPMASTVKISGCDPYNHICVFQRSRPVTAELSFQTYNSAYQSIYLTVEADIGGRWVTLAHQKPICTRLIDGSCPLFPGRKYTYRETHRIPTIIPVQTDSKFRVRIIDRSGVTATCLFVLFRVMN